MSCKIRFISIDKILSIIFTIVITIKITSSSDSNIEMMDNKLNLISNTSYKDNVMMSRQYCGYLVFKTIPIRTRLNISENTVIPAKIFKKLSPLFLNGSVILENSKCRISICGYIFRRLYLKVFGPGRLDDYTRGPCTDFSRSESPVSNLRFHLNYVITAITCGCKKFSENLLCDSPNKCSTRSLEKDTCAILYQDDNCTDCYYQETLLKQGDKFVTNNSIVIRSFILRQKCKLSISSYGDRIQPGNYSKIFENTTNSLSPSVNADGGIFTCECPDFNKEVKTDSKDLIPQESTSNLIATITGLVFLIVFFIATVCLILVQYKKRRNSKQAFEKQTEELKEFLMELQSPSVLNEMTKKKAVTFKQPYPFDPKFEIDRKNITLGKVLGAGAFGAVCEGILKVQKSSNNQTLINVAIKSVHPDSSRVNLNDLKSLINEIRIMQHIGSHSNIVKFIGASTNFKKLEILSIMELCRSESLLVYLKDASKKLKTEMYKIENLNQNKDTDYSEVVTVPIAFMNRDSSPKTSYSAIQTLEEQKSTTAHQNIDILEKKISKETNQVKISPNLARNLLRWSKEVAEGMDFLSDKNVLHIDLAARNILLSEEDLTAKISDFGLSRKLYDSLDLDPTNRIQEYTKLTGLDRIPCPWIALESLKSNTYSSKSDIWGYGVTIWEIFNLGKEPYAKFDFNQLIVFLQGGKRLDCPEFASDKIYSKMLTCWNSIPEERPNFTEIKIFFEKLLTTFETENAPER